MKAHAVTGGIHWQVTHGSWVAFIVPEIVIMANDADHAATQLSDLMFQCVSDYAQQAAFYAEVMCDGVITFPVIRWSTP